MELTNEQKKTVLIGLMQQLATQAYNHEVMGQTWTTLGNADLAKQCAGALAESTKAMAELQKKLNNLS